MPPRPAAGCARSAPPTWSSPARNRGCSPPRSRYRSSTPTAPRTDGTGQDRTPLGQLRAVLDELVDAGVLDRRRRDGIEYPIWSAVHGLAVLAGQGPLRDVPDATRRHLEELTLTFIDERPGLSQTLPPPYAALPAGLGAGLDRARQSGILRYVPKYSGLDQIFHALGDSSRRAMVERLSRGPASVSELAKPFPVALPTVVQHLGVLEAAGIVTSAKAGRVRTYQLVPGALDGAGDWIRPAAAARGTPPGPARHFP